MLWGIFWKERRSCYHGENVVRTRHTCPALLLTQKQRGHRKDRPRLSPPHLMDGTSELVLFNPARSSLPGPQASRGVSSPWTTLSSVTSPTRAHSSLHPDRGSSQSPQTHLSPPASRHPASLGMSPPPGPARPLGPAERPFPWSLSSADLTPRPPWLAAGTGHLCPLQAVGTRHHGIHCRDVREFHLVPNLNSILLTK